MSLGGMDTLMTVGTAHHTLGFVRSRSWGGEVGNVGLKMASTI